MTPTAWLLLGLMLVVETASHLLLKAASPRAHADTRDMLCVRRLILVPVFWLVVAYFLAMMIAWIGFYSIVSQAQDVMTGTIAIAGLILGGRLVFGEKNAGLFLALSRNGVTGAMPRFPHGSRSARQLPSTVDIPPV